MNNSAIQVDKRMFRAGRLLAQAGWQEPFALTPLEGGANSRAFRVDLAFGAPPLFFKEYFHHPDDPRDRLGTEFAFASFAWDHGLRSLARPYAMDRDGRCALYGFLPGRKIASYEVNEDSLNQSLAFFQALNAFKDTPGARELPAASEACFSLADHWHCLTRRCHRLETIRPGNPLEDEARLFVLTELVPACAGYFQAAQRRAEELGIDPDALIPIQDRCLSPSDFGFHNALLSPEGLLHFLDFEYAGWDDPAKTVGDFFCQPQCPVPMTYYDTFASRIAQGTSDPAYHLQRFALLLSMYRLKWCCIMLNDFLPAGDRRRRFAMDHADETPRKTRQLYKARQALRQFQAGPVPGMEA